MGVRIALTAALLLTACDEATVRPHPAEQDAIARGHAAVSRLGCGACHRIAGIWPRGTTGPSLENFAARGMVAGKLPNRPDTLAAFLLDSSGTAMPTIAMTPAEAADIAAFLHAR